MHWVCWRFLVHRAQCNHHVKKVKLEEDLVENEEEKGGDDIIIDKEADELHDS